MKKDIQSLDELIHDATFINWVHQSNPADVKCWNAWLEQHPEKRQLAEDVAMLVKGITFRKKQLPEAEIAASWIRLQAKINDSAEKRLWFKQRRFRIAAAIALLLASIAVFWIVLYEPTIYYTTQFGEIKNMVLPDSSKVTLNAHSTLAFKPSSLNSADRIVHLEGEAYFRVVKKVTGQVARFSVITKNAKVEVLGTQFNVNSRHDKTSVVLNTGKVKFNVSPAQHTMLEPGDRVEYNGQQHAMTLQKVDPELYSSWRKRKLKFDDTSLMELAQILEDNYGLKVIIENKQLQKKRITGEISAMNVDTILQAVAKLFKIKVRHSDNVVYFG